MHRYVAVDRKPAVIVFLVAFLIPLMLFSENEPVGQITCYVFHDGIPRENIDAFVEGYPSGLTNRDGVVRFLLPEGDCTIRLIGKGIEIARIPTTVFEGETTEIIVTLFDEGREPEVDIEVIEGMTFGPGGAGDEKAVIADPGTLRGTVVSIDKGAPVAGAKIFVRGLPVDALTDDEGIFEIELPGGEHAVSILSLIHI